MLETAPPTPEAQTPGAQTPEAQNRPSADARGASPRARSWRSRLYGWLRWLHVYTSLFSLLAVLFFALTGITLNHPDWTFGGLESRQEIKGTLPAGWRSGGKVDWLAVVEHLRAHDKVRGRAEDTRDDAGEASVSFAAPGYRADAFIETSTGAYTVTVTAQGLVGVLNDFHKGRDSGQGWAWVIDVSGGFLALVSVTGLGLLLYLKRFRVSALAAMVAGAVLVLVLMRLAAG